VARPAKQGSEAAERKTGRHVGIVTDRELCKKKINLV
jgi:hypothetical protein